MPSPVSKAICMSSESLFCNKSIVAIAIDHDALLAEVIGRGAHYYTNVSIGCASACDFRGAAMADAFVECLLDAILHKLRADSMEMSS